MKYIYNATKRKCELLAGIFGIVWSGLATLLFLIFTINSIKSLLDYYELQDSLQNSLGVTLNVTSPILILTVLLMSVFLAVSIVALVCSILVIPSPVRPEGILDIDKRRIALLITSFLTFNLLTLGLEIVVYSAGDFILDMYHNGNEITLPKPTSKIFKDEHQNRQNTQSSSIEGKIAELKHLKELGVLDDETFNAAVSKLIKGLV